MPTIKVIFKGDIRRLVLDEKEPYSKLVSALPGTFSELPKSFHLKFRDDEDDLVTITSTAELQEALELQTKGTLKLIVVPTLESGEIGDEPELISDDESEADDFFVVDAKKPLLEDPSKPEPKPKLEEPKSAEPDAKVDIQVIGKSVLIGKADVQEPLKVVSEEENKGPDEGGLEKKALEKKVPGAPAGAPQKEIPKTKEETPKEEEAPKEEEKEGEAPKKEEAEEKAPKKEEVKETPKEEETEAAPKEEETETPKETEAAPKEEVAKEASKKEGLKKKPPKREGKKPTLSLTSLARSFVSEAKKIAEPVVSGWKTNKSAAEKDKLNSLFIRDVNVPDNTKVGAGKEFVKTWLIENNGTIDWPKSTKVVCIDGNMVKKGKTFNLTRVAVGARFAISVTINAPSKPGRYRSTFRLKDKKEFGHTFWVQIIVPTPKPKPLPKINEKKLNVGAHFVKDSTVPDDTVFTPGFETTKTWRIKNTGKDAWPEGTKLVYVGGNWDMKDCKVDVPFEQQARPGANVDVSVKVTTPKAPGKYSARFQLQLPGGRKFGHKFWVNVKVASASDIADLANQFLTDKNVVAVVQAEIPSVFTSLANGESIVKIVDGVLERNPTLKAHPFVTMVQPLLPDFEKFFSCQMGAMVAIQAMMAKASKPAPAAKGEESKQPKQKPTPKKANVFEAKGKPSPTTKAPEAPKPKPFKHAKPLALLVEMGFNDVELMKKLLVRFNGNLNKVLNHLHTN